MINKKDKDEILANLKTLKSISLNITKIIEEKIIKGEAEIYTDVKTYLSNALSRVKMSNTSLETLSFNHKEIIENCKNIINLVDIELNIFDKNKTDEIQINDDNKNNLKQIYQIWSELGKLLGKDLKYLSAEISTENELIKYIEKFEKLIKQLEKNHTNLIKNLDKYIVEKSNNNLELESRYIYFEYLIIKFFVDNKNNFLKKTDWKKKLEVSIKCFDNLILNMSNISNANYLNDVIINTVKGFDIFKINDTENIYFLIDKGFKGNILVYNLNNNLLDFDIKSKSIRYESIKNGIKIGLSEKRDGFREGLKEINSDEINSIIEEYPKNNIFYINLNKVLDDKSFAPK